MKKIIASFMIGFLGLLLVPKVTGVFSMNTNVPCIPAPGVLCE